jgi:hypothetical protein
MKTKPGEAQAFMAAALATETDDCIPWPFSLMVTSGYPQFWADGKNGMGHRYACAHRHGPCPEGYEATHSCGVKACINSRHLRWGTRADNEADKVLHGRSNRGERHGSAKLTEGNVRAIRTAEGTQIAIAVRFGVAEKTVWKIKNRKAWRHL